MYTDEGDEMTRKQRLTLSYLALESYIGSKFSPHLLRKRLATAMLPTVTFGYGHALVR